MLASSRSLLPHRRLLSLLTSLGTKYSFYDLVKETHRRPPHNALPVSLVEKRNEETLKRAAIEGNYKLEDLTPEERIAKVFGGRIKGEDRQSSSRMNIGKPRTIAGVLVPARPLEPDNCCMSGCINCVWEIYNDDVKDWNRQRKKAASNLKSRGGVWPEDFNPPVELLNPENVPASMAREAAETNKRGDNKEPWEKVPVQIRVFAEVEKKLKAKKKSALL